MRIAARCGGEFILRRYRCLLDVGYAKTFVLIGCVRCRLSYYDINIPCLCLFRMELGQVIIILYDYFPHKYK